MGQEVHVNVIANEVHPSAIVAVVLLTCRTCRRPARRTTGIRRKETSFVRGIATTVISISRSDVDRRDVTIWTTCRDYDRSVEPKLVAKMKEERDKYSSLAFRNQDAILKNDFDDHGHEYRSCADGRRLSVVSLYSNPLNLMKSMRDGPSR